GEAVGECVEHEPGSLIHGAGLTPGHRAIPPKGSALVCSKCYLCARSNLLPMSPVCTLGCLTPGGKLRACPAPSRVNCYTSSHQLLGNCTARASASPLTLDGTFHSGSTSRATVATTRR